MTMCKGPDFFFLIYLVAQQSSVLLGENHILVLRFTFRYTAVVFFFGVAAEVRNEVESVRIEFTSQEPKTSLQCAVTPSAEVDELVGE